MISTPIIRAVRQAVIVSILAVPLLAGGSAAAAGAISQGFTTQDNAVTGSLMDLRADTQNAAELANSGHADRLLGVVGNKTLIELGDGSKQIQVVTSGLTEALVSDINGTVRTGDRITASPIQGVGMKATSSTTVVGTAQENMTTSHDTTRRTITDKSGQRHTVTIASIPIQVNVTFYAAGSGDQLSPMVPSFLQALGNSIAGHNVSALRVIVGFFALAFGFTIVLVILYTAVRSGLIAIGRNPMAQKALRKGLAEVILTAIAVLILTLLVIYITLVS